MKVGAATRDACIRPGARGRGDPALLHLFRSAQRHLAGASVPEVRGYCSLQLQPDGRGNSSRNHRRNPGGHRRAHVWNSPPYRGACDRNPRPMLAHRAPSSSPRGCIRGLRSRCTRAQGWLSRRSRRPCLLPKQADHDRRGRNSAHLPCRDREESHAAPQSGARSRWGGWTMSKSASATGFWK